MADITTTGNGWTPAPRRERKGHVPAPGDIYYGKDSFYPRIFKILRRAEGPYETYEAQRYDILGCAWDEGKPERVSRDTLDEYYRLVLGDFDEIASMARAAVGGDPSAVEALLREGSGDPKETSLILSRPSKQVYALTETAERLQDKVATVKDMMDIIIAVRRSEMEAKVRSLSAHLEKMNEYVEGLHRIITVMNLYTGRDVDLKVVRDGAQAPSGEPIHVRQRILYADEEYLADAANGGIGYEDMEAFYRWCAEPANRDTLCPEPKCIVALKPKRYNKPYSSDPYTNAVLNKWNHHTIILIRDGERLLALDSEDLELYGTAIPYSDQQERFEKEAEGYLKDRSFQEHNLKRLKEKSENLGYMYAKYISFLQGLVDGGRVFDLSAGRPNFGKEEGVAYVHDAENAIGTGESWEAFQGRLNAGIQRGTRVVFFPGNYDESGYAVPCGKPNRYYWHDASAPGPPKEGVYNVDYPSKTERVWDEKAGRNRTELRKGGQLAIFYTPHRGWWSDSDKPRNEAWLYNPACVVNYDALTVEDIDRYAADRTQREHFRAWLPLLQKARAELVKEREGEDQFAALMCNDIRRQADIPQEELKGLVREAIAWWKGKVIFTRALRSDDAKAWRMIRGRVTGEWKRKKGQ